MGGMGRANSSHGGVGGLGHPNGVGLDRYLEIYSSSVGMDRDQLQSMMMNRPIPTSQGAPAIISFQ